MNFFLKNIVFNKHIKYKRYNNKFLNSIIEYFLQKSYPEVLNASKSIKLNKKNTLNINDFGIKIYSQNEEDGIILYLLKHIGIKTKKFIEIGPGKVLSGLIKRIDKNVTVNSINSEDDISKININD